MGSARPAGQRWSDEATISPALCTRASLAARGSIAAQAGALGAHATGGRHARGAFKAHAEEEQVREAGDEVLRLRPVPLGLPGRPD